MANIRKFVGPGVLAISLAHAAACGVQGEAYQPRPVPAAKSVVYIYRPYKYYESSAAPMVTCGSESIEMEGGGYYSWIENLGTVTCTSTAEGTAPLSFEVHPGEEYFIKEELASGSLAARPQFTLMNPQVARAEIKDCNKQGVPDAAAHQ